MALLAVKFGSEPFSLKIKFLFVITSYCRHYFNDTIMLFLLAGTNDFQKIRINKNGIFMKMPFLF